MVQSKYNLHTVEIQIRKTTETWKIKKNMNPKHEASRQAPLKN